MTDDLLYLSRADVAALLLPVGEQIDLAERTYRELAEGRVELPPKPGVHPRPDCFVHAMPAYLAHDDVVALKWVAGYPPNKQKGLPYISAVIVVNDAETGAVAAVLDGAEITAARTAAGSGVCVRHFAPDGWRRVGVVGAGEQAAYHLRVFRALQPELVVRAWDPHLERIEQLGVGVVPAESWEDAVAGAEVVLTAAPIVENAASPLEAEHVAERCLGLPIDFDAYFSAGAVSAGELFLVDDVGQFEYYREAGYFRDWPAPAASLGEALAAATPAPARVVCANLGIGALDAAFAASVVAAARAEGVGTALPR